MGSLWASFEIIVGSFLHNLKVPFSGTTLSFASVFLVIAYVQIWREKGLVWRAGLICALMKSLSPSAVILGPMIGIMTEALILSIMIGLLGRNLISYVLAGGLAVLSALLHKVISLLILYGMDLVRILEGLYNYAVKQLRITGLDPVTLIVLLALIYFTAGIIASVLGYLAGQRYLKHSFRPEFNEMIALEKGNRLFSISEKRKYSMTLLFSHLGAVVICLWLMNKDNLYLYLPASILYMAGCIYWYRRNLRYLKKVSFWIQFILITLLAAFLLEGYSSGNYFSVKGMIVGLKMNLRAFIIMVGFTAISTELKNPLIKSVLYNKGFSSLYQSLNLAFSALPGIISLLPKSKEFFKNRLSVLSTLLKQSEILLKQFESNHNKRSQVIILTGDVGQGKTTFAMSLQSQLKAKGIKTAGFFSLGVHENNQRIGFDLVDLLTGQQLVISRNLYQEGWIKQSHYYFDPSAFQHESELLWQQVEAGTDILIIDEVGPLELNDSGWNQFIETICREKPVPMIWIVRKSLVRQVARKWNVGDVYIFNIDENKDEELLELILKMTNND